MSEALYGLGGLRFWNENEIELREMFTQRAISVVKTTLLSLNPAWQFARMEGPCLSPREKISPSYDDDDLFATNHKAGASNLYLRAETTPSSYEYAKAHMKKPPFCVYQAGKSFRRETSDGATASKLRFNEFYQLEFQCIYAVGTKADYRAALIPAIASEIERFTRKTSRVVDSDRLPAYSESTKDIEVLYMQEPCLFTPGWREMASCSIRTDFAEDKRVCEIAIGIDRVVSFST